MSDHSEFDFSDQTVIVAGGTSGINLGVAKDFAEAGANIGVISRSPEKVASAVDDLQQAGGQVAGYSADVRDYEILKLPLRLSTKSSAHSMCSSPVRLETFPPKPARCHRTDSQQS